MYIALTVRAVRIGSKYGRTACAGSSVAFNQGYGTCTTCIGMHVSEGYGDEPSPLHGAVQLSQHGNAHRHQAALRCHPLYQLRAWRAAADPRCPVRPPRTPARAATALAPCCRNGQPPASLQGPAAAASAPLAAAPAPAAAARSRSCVPQPAQIHAHQPQSRPRRPSTTPPPPHCRSAPHAP